MYRIQAYLHDECIQTTVLTIYIMCLYLLKYITLLVFLFVTMTRNYFHVILDCKSINLWDTDTYGDDVFMDQIKY